MKQKKSLTSNIPLQKTGSSLSPKLGVTARGKKLKSSNLTGACSEWNVASRNADPQLTGDGRRIGLQIQIHDRETNFGQKRDEHGWTEWKIRGQTSTKEATRKESNGERDNAFRLDPDRGGILRAPFYILVILLYCLHSRPHQSQEN